VRAAAGLGAAVSFYVCVGCWLGRYAKMADNPRLWLLFCAVPVVWLPTLLFLRKSFPGARKRAVFKIALRQAPPFRKAVFYGSLAYSIVVWCVAIAAAIGKSGTRPHEGIFFSAAMLVIYAAAGAMCAAALAAAGNPESVTGTLR
jgi:hypothetical protein